MHRKKKKKLKGSKESNGESNQAKEYKTKKTSECFHCKNKMKKSFNFCGNCGKKRIEFNTLEPSTKVQQIINATHNDNINNNNNNNENYNTKHSNTRSAIHQPESLHLILILHDNLERSEILSASDALAQLLGYHKNELTNQKLNILLSPQLFNVGLYQNNHNTLSTPNQNVDPLSRKSIQSVLRHKDGSLYFVEFDAFSFPNQFFNYLCCIFKSYQKIAM